MTVSASLLGTANASNTDAQTYTRVVTPADNAVLFVVATARAGTTPGSATISDTAGLTWTPVADVPNNVLRTMVWRASVVGTSPGSITITVDWGATVDGCSRGVIECLGADLSSPVVGTAATNTGTSTGPNVGTLSALASAGNARLLFVGHARAAANQTEEAGWTELCDVANTTPPQGLAAYALTGSDDTTPTCTLGGSAIWMAIAIEVAVSASATSFAGTDTATASEGGPALALTGPVDGATLADAASLSQATALSGADAATLAENAGTLRVAEPGADATLTDTGQVAASIPEHETAFFDDSGANDTIQLGAGLAFADGGSLAEAVALLIASAVADGATLAEAGTAAVTIAYRGSLAGQAALLPRLAAAAATLPRASATASFTPA
jgi:hypothetical protein